MHQFTPTQADTLEHILDADKQAREQADKVIETLVA